MTQAEHAPGSRSIEAELRSLAAERSSGVVEVGARGRIWLHEGGVYLIEVEGGPPLEEVLFGADIGSLDELRDAFRRREPDIAAKAATGRPESASALRRLLHEHNLNGLFELSMPGEGDIVVSSQEVHPLGPRFAEPVGDLLDEAARRVEVWRSIAARIPSTAVVFGLTRSFPGDQQERVVTADEWLYLSLLDGHRTVADVIKETGQSAFRVTSALYRLLLEGLIEER